MTWDGRAVTRRIWKDEVAEQDSTHRNKEEKDCRRLPQQRRKLRTVKCRKCHQDCKPEGSDEKEERGLTKRRVMKHRNHELKIHRLNREPEYIVYLYVSSQALLK